MPKNQLNLKTIKQIDKTGMLDLLLDFPQQCRTALDIAGKAGVEINNRNFNKIIFIGVGGSAIGADVVRSYLYLKSRIPISVFREYALPACVDSSSLVFILSYSGNTEEVLTVYRQAVVRGANIVAISSGGRLKEFAEKDKVAFIQVPGGLPPRCALGYLSIVPLCLLGKLGIIKEPLKEVASAIETLEGLRDKSLNPCVGIKDNIAKSISRRLFNKFIVIYSASMHFDVCATRFRAQLSENSKVLASSHVFPELNHGEIVGWQNPKRLFRDFMVLVLRDAFIHPSVAKSMDIVEDMLKKENISVIEIHSQGPTLLSRIFSLIYTGDFISYYLAILYRVDPEPVDRIVYLKKKLSENKIV